MSLDTPTVDAAGLAALPAFTLPPTYHLGRAGLGCAFDPPGYPTYYLRPVYTKRGDDPPRGPCTTLAGRVVATAEGDASVADDAPLGRLLAGLYRPLPMDDPRVSAWIAEVFRHLRGCYADPKNGSPRVPSLGDTLPLGWEVVSNLSAVRLIRKTYPAFEPSLALLNGPDTLPTAWWERAPSDLPNGAAMECLASTIRQSGDAPKFPWEA